MKHLAKYLLQKILGFDNYLYIFSLFKTKTLRWDSNENQIFHFISMIPEEGTILDIGANIGIMTTLISKHRPKADIVAFEPMPQNLKALKKIVSDQRLNNVQIIEHALGDKAGSVKMVMPVEGDVKLQGLSHVVDEDKDKEVSGVIFDAELHQLDEYNWNKPVVGIKIDVENFEYYVLKGASELLAKYKPIVYCELWEDEQRRQTIELMNEIGYNVFFLEGRQLQVFIDGMQDVSHNFFFLPKDKQSND